jgi:hypothetical protein
MVMGSAHVTSHPVLTMHQGFNNPGDSTGHMTHTFSKSWTDTIEVSITAGISSTLTSKMEASVGLPEGIASLGGGVEASVTVSLQESLAVSKSVTTTLSMEGSYDVPPHTYADMSWVVNLDDCTIPFSQDVTIDGQVAIWFDHKREIQPGGGNHNLWFIPISTLLAAEGRLPQGFSFAGGAAVVYTVQGSLQGSIGSAGDVTTTTRPAVSTLPPGDVSPSQAETMSGGLRPMPAEEAVLV